MLKSIKLFNTASNTYYCQQVVNIVTLDEKPAACSRIHNNMYQGRFMHATVVFLLPESFTRIFVSNVSVSVSMAYGPDLVREVNTDIAIVIQPNRINTRVLFCELIMIMLRLCESAFLLSPSMMH